VTDSNGNIGLRTMTLNVTTLANITGNSAAGSSIGSPFSLTLAANGGTPPFNWTLATGTALPPGLSLSNGTITGTPTAAGQYTVYLNITDNSASQILVPITIGISDLTITGSSYLPTAITNEAYSTTLSATGGTPPYTWFATGYLPAGLALSSAGVLSGIVGAGGTVDTINVAVLDANSKIGIRSLILPVEQHANSGLSTTSVSSGYSLSLHSSPCCLPGAYGGTPPYTWSLVAGSLPPGTDLYTTSSGGAALSGVLTTPGIYPFRLKVSDAAGGAAYSTVTITVQETINPPVATLNSAYSTTLTAQGLSAPVSFALAPENVFPAGMTLSSAGVLSGTPTDTGSQTFYVQMTDSNGRTIIASVSFEVSGGTISICCIPQSYSNIIQISAVQQVSFSLFPVAGETYTVASGSSLPPGLYLSGAGIWGAPTVPGIYTTTLLASGAQRTFTFSIGPQFQIFTRAFPILHVGQAVSLNFNAVGGTLPYTWSVDPASLPPPGLSLNSQGVLSGTPTANGSFYFTVDVTDASTPQNRLTYSASVLVSPMQFSTAGPLPLAQQGQYYTTSITATGGLAPITYSTSSSLPTGISLSSTGAITGMPEAFGNYEPYITATDSTGVAISQYYHLYVQSGGATPLVALPIQAPNNTFVTGSPINYLLTAVGGAPPYTWSVANNSSLPVGVSLLQSATLPVPAYAPGDAILTGVVTSPGNYNFTLIATDSAKNTATRAYLLSGSAITVSTPQSTNGAVGTAFSYDLVASGGTAPYNWSTWSGTLPYGLTLSADGIVSGTPTDSGSFTATFAMTDSSQPPRLVYRTATFTISSSSSLQWSTGTSWGPYAVNSPLTIYLYATGGAPPYGFSVPSGSTLPAGLTLSGANITGTPTAPGRYIFPVLMTDSAMSAVTRNFYLEVSPISVTPSVLPAAQTGSPYSATLSASGSTAPYAFYVYSLPVGLSVSGTGAISGTPTDGGYLFLGTAVYDGSVPGNSASLGYSLSSNETVYPSYASPSYGSGLIEPFTLAYTDTAGVGDFTSAAIWFTNDLTPSNFAQTCLVQYNAVLNQFTLLSDAGAVTAQLTAPPGATPALSNSQCAVSNASVTTYNSTTGANLVLGLSITFQNSFRGAKDIFMSANGRNAASGWDYRGSWTVPVPSPVPVFQVSKTHTGNFTQGQVGTYSITVSNQAGAASSLGLVTVTDTLPYGLTVSSMSGTGWSCATLTCTRSDSLAGGSSYPAITLVANVAANAPSPLVNDVTVSGGGSPTTSTTDTTVVVPSTFTPIRVKSCGAPFVDSAGNTWSADTGYGGGSCTSTTSPISGTTDSTLYQSARYIADGSLTYQFNVPNGAYSMTLKFAEIIYTSAGQRIFNIAVNGTTVTLNFDIVAAAGAAFKAYDLTYPLAVTNGQVVVTFTSVMGGASISALQVVPLSTPDFSLTAAPSSQTVNAGNGAGYQVNGIALNGFNGNVTFAVSTSPTGILASLAQPSVNGSGAVGLTVSTTSSSSPGTYTITVVGTSGTSTRSASVFLVVSGIPSSPTLAIAKTHLGIFEQGQTNATYAIVVTNHGGSRTSGIVTVTDAVPTGLTLNSMTGAGWNCPDTGATCTRSDSLLPSTSYPPITVTVEVAASAPASVANQASVSGGGSASFSSTDVTMITSPNGCTLKGEGINISDVQLLINQALGVAQPADDLNNDGGVNIVDVEIMITASLGLGCTV